MNTGTMNLLEAYNRKPTPRRTVVRIVIILCLFVTLSAANIATLLMYFDITAMRRDIDIIDEFLTSQGTVSGLALHESLSRAVQNNENVLEEFRNDAKDAASYGAINKNDLLRAINALGGRVSVTSIQITGTGSKTLQLQCTAATVNDVSSYIRALKNLDIFKAVLYNGYRTGSQGEPTFGVTCYLYEVSGNE